MIYQGGQLTTDGDLFALAGRHAADVGELPQQPPGLEQELEDVAGVQLLLGGSCAQLTFLLLVPPPPLPLVIPLLVPWTDSFPYERKDF